MKKLSDLYSYFKNKDRIQLLENGWVKIEHSEILSLLYDLNNFFIDNKLDILETSMNKNLGSLNTYSRAKVFLFLI